MIKLLIANNYLKRSLKDYTGVLILIIMPLIFILINGKVLESAFNPQDKVYQVSVENSKNIKEKIDIYQYIKEIDLNSYKKITVMQHFASSMLVMFMLFTATMGASNMMKEKEEHTLMRIMASPVREFDILSGKFMGNMLLALVQAAVIILFTRFVYGVDWGNSLGGILLVTVIIVFVSASISFFLSMITKSAKMAGGVTTVLILLMSFISGSFTPLNSSETLNLLSNFTINKWAFDSYQKLMSGRPINTIYLDLTVLVSTGIIFMLLSVFILKKRGYLYE